jgi:uncharacterized protein (DUF1501 family)
MKRRKFLQASSIGLATGLLPLSNLTFANAQTSNRLVVMLLRGGLDGMHALVPYGDPNYARLRSGLAVDLRTSTLRLNGLFGLHPALEPLAAMYRQGELSFVPAATTRYRDRSHFDGQNLLEVGSHTPFGLHDGWLNRALQHLTHRSGLALGPNVPTILQGSVQVATWADSPLPEVDEDFLNRVAYLYQEDASLSMQLDSARNTPETEVDSKMGRGGRNQQLVVASQAASQLLADPTGPRVAVIESGGWDTHFAQERRLSQQFTQLSEALLTLKQGLGQVWQNTCVLVVSEFGRTAAENGSGGTDHGIGGLAMLAGGRVNGGKMFGDWPGLRSRDLFEGRDLTPTVHYESIFKSVLHDLLEIPQRTIETSIFPDSSDLKPLSNILTYERGNRRPRVVSNAPGSMGFAR